MILGGAGTMEDFYEAAALTNADGILAASVFHFGEIKINELKSYLKDKGVAVRISVYKGPRQDT
jgi:cyclase